MEFNELIRKRRSIRKYQSTPIPDEDIIRFIEAAVTAPSGCNSQCWHFVALKGLDKISALAKVVEESVENFYRKEFESLKEGFIKERKKALTFFKNAPVVIVVFLTGLTYYDERVTKLYKDNGYSYRDVMDKLGSPDILSIGAAIENMLLAIEDMGYGACWMNDPVIAEEDIKRFLNVSEDYRLMSLIPVGLPAYRPREKDMKPLSEVLEILGQDTCFHTNKH